MSAIVAPVSPKEKSTTVRPDYARVPRFIRASFQLGSRVLPRVAARAAEYIFFRPHRRSSRVPDAPHHVRVEIDGGQVAAYVWGETGPATLLLHGWEGCAAQMAPLAKALAADGHRVVAIDLPAHGRSSGSQTNLLEVAAAVEAIAAELGPFSAVVGHSFGAAAAMLTAVDLDIPKVVTIGGPASLRFVVHSFARALGLEPAAEQRFDRRLVRRFGPAVWRDLSPQQLAEQLDTSGALVIHDEDDSAVPIEQARELIGAWPGARLFTTQRLGHYRVLRSPEVHHAVRGFLHHEVSP